MKGSLEERLRLPSDLYSRNVLIAKGIQAYKKEKELERLRILDVGGRNGRLELFLDHSDDLTILDIRDGDEENLVLGDATNMEMFAPNTFDVVVSGDVFEHIPQALREQFLSESLRVARGLVVLAAPFEDSGVREAEELVNEYFKELTGNNHEWLEEHFQMGLPKRDELEHFLKSRGRYFTVQPSGDLENWILLQLLIFYSYRFGVQDELIEQFYASYNQDLFQVEDFRMGSYRQVYFISQEDFPVEVFYQPDVEKRQRLRKKAFDLLRRFSNEHLDWEPLRQQIRDAEERTRALQSEVNRQGVSLHDSIQLLHQKDGYISGLKDTLQNFEQRWTQYSAHVEQKDQHIREVQQQLDHKKAEFVQVLEEQSQLLQKMAQLQQMALDSQRKAKEQQELLLQREEQLEAVVDRYTKQHALLKTLDYRIGQLRTKAQARLLAQRATGVALQRSQKRAADLLAQLNAADQQLLNVTGQLRTIESERDQLLQEAQEYRQVQRSLTGRFLAFHRRLSQALLRFFSDLGLGFALLKREGVMAFIKRASWYLRGKRLPSEIPGARGPSLDQQYREFLNANNRGYQHLQQMKEESRLWTYRPLISILVPVYNVDPKWLDACIGSVMNQVYEDWELCLHDDASTNPDTIACLKKWQHKDDRIRVSFSEVNQNISGASNMALMMARGEYIALLDNDDELSPDALFEVVKTLRSTQADVMYSDEDFIDEEGFFVSPHCKPDFSPDLLLSHNYITHLLVFSRALLDQVGGFREEYNGAQDHDLVLRLTEKAKKIVHIPKVLYHWRRLPSSTSSDPHAKPAALDNAFLVLEDTLKRRKIQGEVFPGNIPFYFRVKRKILEHPLVSIIIPFRDKPELLDRCVRSILDKSTYENIEIIGMNNGSVDHETLALMQYLDQRDSRVRFYDYDQPFNFSAINNYAAEHYAVGEHLLLLNNDVEVINDDWIEALLEHSQRPEVGAVGAKLFYPNNQVQHAGVVIGIGGYAGHAHKGFLATDAGYFNRLNVIQNVSAVTGACLMVKAQLYEQMGGLNADDFGVACNDVDFCLRLLEAGYLNVFTPYSQLYHYESRTRGYEDTSEKMARFSAEKQAFQRRHRALLRRGDPFYNPQLTLEREDFGLRLESDMMDGMSS